MRDVRIGRVCAHRRHEAEVEQLRHIAHTATFAHDNIAGLDVAMNKAQPMRLAQCAADLQQEMHGALGGERSVVLHKFLQRRTGEVLHGIEERAVFGVAVVENLY